MRAKVFASFFKKKSLFFFEKKNQKNFYPFWLLPRWNRVGSSDLPGRFQARLPCGNGAAV
jgi:hypothetical protein